MSGLMDVIRMRRSVRDYSSEPLGDDLVRRVVEAARLAPSACNAQPWRFIAARGEAKRRLAEEALGGLVVPNRWAAAAPVMLAACADLSVIPHAAGRHIKGIEYHLLDMGAAIEHLLLAAAELGLGSCWIGWFDEAAARRALGIPARIRVVSLIALGHPKEPLPGREPERKPLDDILFWDAWPR